jgi:hypothetical protein
MSLVDTAFYVPKQPRGTAFWKLLLMLVLIVLVLQRVCHAEGANVATATVPQLLPHGRVCVSESLMLVTPFFK